MIQAWKSCKNQQIFYLLFSLCDMLISAVLFRPHCVKSVKHLWNLVKNISISWGFFRTFCSSLLLVLIISLFATPCVLQVCGLLRYGQYGTQQATITASPHIVANVLYPPLCLAAQGRLMCLGHGHNLVRQIWSPLAPPIIWSAQCHLFFGGEITFSGTHFCPLKYWTSWNLLCFEQFLNFHIEVSCSHWCSCALKFLFFFGQS